MEIELKNNTNALFCLKIHMLSLMPSTASLTRVQKWDCDFHILYMETVQKLFPCLYKSFIRLITSHQMLCLLLIFISMQVGGGAPSCTETNFCMQISSRAA